MTTPANEAALRQACEAWMDENHGQDHSVVIDALIRFARTQLAEAQVWEDVENRDKDWILAMGHAIGLDSGYYIPLVPSVEAFRKFFAAIQERDEFKARAALRQQLATRTQERDTLKECLTFCGAILTDDGNLEMNMKKYHAAHRCALHRADPWEGIGTECAVCLKQQLEQRTQERDAALGQLRANDTVLELHGVESRPQSLYIMDLRQQLTEAQAMIAQLEQDR